MNDEPLTDHQKETILRSIVDTAKTCLGIPYDIEPGPPDIWTGRGKWLDLTKLPPGLDCSGLSAGACHKVGLKYPDGAQHQYDYTIAIEKPRPGDFGFFGHDGQITRVYHTGIFDGANVIEARALDKKASFETGKIIMRPSEKWTNFKPYFLGWRSHPRLI